MNNPLVSHFQMLAKYNKLANRRLYETCAKLDRSERDRIRPAFFQSIHGTPNHIMVGDRIWLARFEGQEVPSTGQIHDMLTQTDVAPPVLDMHRVLRPDPD